MKLKNFLGLAICVSMLACSATSVFAAATDNGAEEDKIETFRIGTPINVETGEDVTNLEAGQIVAFPVNIITNRQIVSFSYGTACDTEYLAAGVADDELSDEAYDYLTSLGQILEDTDVSLDYYVFAMGDWKRGKFTSWGYPGVAVTPANKVNWYDGYERNVFSDKPEFYLLYRVVKSVSIDDLNHSLIWHRDGHCQVGVYDFNDPDDEGNIRGGDTLYQVPNKAVANACYGAFKINLNTTTLTKWVQGLQVSINDGDKKVVDEYVTTDNVNYSFPVRITSNSGEAETATVAVYADVSNSETDTTNTTNVKIGEFTVDLDTPTAYDGQSLNY